MPEEQGYDLPKIPAGYTQEDVAEGWNIYQEKVKADKDWANRNANIPIVSVFNSITNAGLDVELDSDVETPSSSGPASLALRIVGMTGQGLATLGGQPVAGAAFNMGANALANQFDHLEGGESEILPFSGVVSDAMGVENPATTGNPLFDAVGEGLVDAAIGVGALSKMGKGISELRGGMKYTQKYIAKHLDPQYMKDLTDIEELSGQTIPVMLAQDGVSGTLGKSLRSALTSDSSSKAIDDTTNALTNAWKASFDVEDEGVLNNLVKSFNNGLDLGRNLKNADGLLPTQKESIISMTKLKRAMDSWQEARSVAKSDFAATKPTFMLTNHTAGVITNARKHLKSLDVLGDSSLKGLDKSLEALTNKILNPTAAKMVQRGNTRFSVFDPDFQLLFNAEKGTPNTILELVESVDNKITSIAGSKMPPSLQEDVTQQLTKVRDSLESNMWQSLTPEQLQKYEKYREITKQVNSMPQKITDAVATGEFDGFMSVLIRDKDAMRKFIDSNTVTRREVNSMVGDFLLQQGRKTTKEGKDTIDFVAIKNFVDNPANRTGIVEALGSENMGLFRQFANVAANTNISGTGKSGVRNMLSYSPLATGASAFVIYNPMVAMGTAAATAGIRIGVNRFLKNILFNPKIGREAIDMLKQPANSTGARKSFAAVMTALNGAEATAVALDSEGKTAHEKRVVIRMGPGNHPMFVPMDQ